MFLKVPVSWLAELVAWACQVYKIEYLASMLNTSPDPISLMNRAFMIVSFTTETQSFYTFTLCLTWRVNMSPTSTTVQP